jgi:organic hydroperoxide reductase OsmC/OhrA
MDVQDDNKRVRVDEGEKTPGNDRKRWTQADLGVMWNEVLTGDGDMVARTARVGELLNRKRSSVEKKLNEQLAIVLKMMAGSAPRAGLEDLCRELHMTDEELAAALSSCHSSSRPEVVARREIWTGTDALVMRMTHISLQRDALVTELRAVLDVMAQQNVELRSRVEALESEHRDASRETEFVRRLLASAESERDDVRRRLAEAGDLGERIAACTRM